MQRYYDLIDVLAYPRHRMRLTELVTPLKPLEAMAQGRMFVASDVGGHRELIRDGETGFLFPAGDAAALARDARARARAQARLWPRMRARRGTFVETERTWARSVAPLRRRLRRAAAGRRPGACARSQRRSPDRCAASTASSSSTAAPAPAETLRAWASSRVHRGPDDEGVHVDGPLAFGMRRLSIIDVAGGHQPLTNEDGTSWLVCNGEIYNFRELRARAAGARAIASRRTRDSETVVHLYEEYGDAFLEHA